MIDTNLKCSSISWEKVSPISSAPLAAWPQPPAARTKPSPNFGFMPSTFGFICFGSTFGFKRSTLVIIGVYIKTVCFSPYQGYQQKAQSCPGCLTWHRNLQSHRPPRDLAWELAPRWPRDKFIWKFVSRIVNLPAFLRDWGPDQSCNGSLRPPACNHKFEIYSFQYLPLCATLWRDHGLQTWGSVSHLGRGLGVKCKCNGRAPTAMWCKDPKTI